VGLLLDRWPGRIVCQSFIAVLPMRILGAILLIAGFLLCFTIVWAAIGFLAMGLGLICLRIAERRQERIKRLHSVVVADVELDRPEVPNETLEHAVASSATPPELPKAEAPLHVAGFGSPTLPKIFGIEGERGAVVTAARRSYDAERDRSITKDRADFPRLENVAKPSPLERVGPLAETDPGLPGRTSRPAASSLDPFRRPRDGARKPGNAGGLTGSDPSVTPTDTFDRPLTSSPLKSAATSKSHSRQAAPSRPEPGALRRPTSHSGAGSRVAGGSERPGAVTSAKGESGPRRHVTDAEDVRNLAELLGKIGRPRPDAESW
jgi:hypothetical protein